MFEKVSRYHVDKVADRIAGAIVDLAYKKEENPKIAVEVLIGHGQATVMIESSYPFEYYEIHRIVQRISNIDVINVVVVPQDVHLSSNQKEKPRCGDNGIFKGMPVTEEQKKLTRFVRSVDEVYPCDGKYILTDKKLIACQSNVETERFKLEFTERFGYLNNVETVVNPLGDWTGGSDVDCGATNRKLGSDMGDSVTGGGLHGKDLSKADVSVNIYAFLKAQKTNKPVELSCAIGDDTIDGLPYEQIVEIARTYIESLGGFESFAEWGLIR